MGYIHRKYSNTNNHINLNYIPQTNPRVEVKFTATNQYGFVFGMYPAWHKRDAFALTISDDRLGQLSYYVGGAYNNYAGQTASGETYVIDFTTTSYTINGVTTFFSSNYTAGTANPFLIGAASENGVASYVLKEFFMEYLRIYEGNTLMYNLVAAKNNDGYGCLKNTLTNTIYNFTNPSDIEYISTFDPSKSTFNFSSTGGNESFVLTANTGWTATTASDWVSLNSMTGTTGGTLVLTCNRNYTETARTATITFTDANGETFNINVNQKRGTAKYSANKLYKDGELIFVRQLPKTV